MAESEKQLELKKRARRRLVGASALALAAAVVLPMVMDHEPKPLTHDIQIRIPNPDRPAGDAGAASSKPTQGAKAPDTTSKAAEAKPAAEAAASAPEARPESKPPQPAAEPDKPKAEAARPEPAKPAPAVEAKPAKVEVAPKEAAAEAKPATKADREARVESILAGNEPAAAGGDFVVQLGAFGDPANAAKVRTRVKAAGFNSYTETVKGPKGDQIRVRAGPFANRDAADRAAAKLKHAGLAGVVAAK